MVLVKASCEECQIKIGRFEEKCLRGILAPARAYLGLRSRKSKKKKFKLQVTFEGKSEYFLPSSLNPFVHKYERQIDAEDAQIDVKRFGGCLPMLVLVPPPILSGTHSSGFEYETIKFIHIGSLPEERTQFKPFTQKINFTPSVFFKLIAKIALCTALTKIEYDAFSKFFVTTSLIDPEVSNHPYIGCDTQSSPPSKNLHEINIHVDNNRLVMVRVRIFANLGGVEYLVVVGRLKSKSSPAPPTSPTASKSPA